MMIRNSFLTKTISLSLAFLILGEIIFPTAAMAMLTSGESQPEIYGYTPAESSDNVGLSTGMFNYTIPITSVPEYPMGISYHNGGKQDDEAGVFGFGFSGFSGAIGRTVIGLPDDLLAGEQIYDFDNEKNWSASAGASIGYTIAPGVGIGAGLTVGYDNYIGCFVSLGLTAGISASSGGNVGVSAGIGISLVSDSRSDKVGFGIGITVGVDAKGHNAGSIINMSISNTSKDKDIDASMSTTFSISDFKMTPPAISSISMPPLANVGPTSRGWGVSMTVPLVVYPVSVSGSFDTFSTDDNKKKSGYGYMYLSQIDRAKEGDAIISDFTIEGEDSHNAANQVNPVYLQKDYFAINAMGLSGNMQLYQEHYGVVSRHRARNQYRDIGLIGINTNREEVFPWTEVTQSSFNQNIDVLALFKKKKGNDDTKNDFDNVLFKETPVAGADIKSDPFKFKETKFKMRGDLAGEFDMVSNGVADNSFMGLGFANVTADGSGKLGFLKYEKKMPLYKPQISNYTKNKKIETSTQIKKHTIGEMIRKYEEKPFSADVLQQSIYYQHKYNANNGDNLNNYLETYNVLEDLKAKSNNSYIKNQIGWIEVQKADGMRYVFNLPAFTNESVTMQIAGKGANPPIRKGSEYATSSGKNRGKSTVLNNYKYPYAWLLTAVVGPDYVDIDDIPGPSDGDIGYWVKFKYAKTSNAYVWRAPYSGLNHLPGAIEISEDDSYSMQKGSKEIFVLSEVESSEYLTKYNYTKRKDGIDAPETNYNGKAINTLQENATFTTTEGSRGNNNQFCVNQIDLYKKHFTGDNSEQTNKSKYGKKIQSTRFEYDYSTCPNTPNSIANQNAIVGGKLTLRKVQNIAYDENERPISLPSYKLTYWGDINPKYNPSYNEKMKDRWGNYSSQAKNPGSIKNNVNYYSHYCQYDEQIADEDAKIYQLKSIRLPSGGEINIDYKARSYAYVDKQTPYAMRRILAENNNITQMSNGTITLKVDVSDIYTDLKAKHGDAYAAKGLGVSKTELQGYPQGEALVKARDILYGEIAFYQEPKNPSEEKLYIDTCTVRVERLGSISSKNENGVQKYYQEIVLKNPNGDMSSPPFVKGCRTYMYEQSIQMRAIKESLQGCSGAQSVAERYENMDQLDPLEAVKKMISNFRNMFTSTDFKEEALDNCFGKPGTKFFAGLSFLRTPVYKGKYTGSRVHKLTYEDNFMYGASGQDAGNSYGTIYYFDENTDGTGRSAGVATLEPGGGKETVIDIFSLQTKGAGYLPAPTIISSKTTITPEYKNDLEQGISSRKKGKTVYEFYTPKDESLGIMETFKQTELKKQAGNPSGYYYMLATFAFLMFKFKLFGTQIVIKIPFPLFLNLKWNRNDDYMMRGYQYTDYSDIYGSPKSILQYEEGAEKDKYLAKQYYEYYKPNETIPTYKNGFNNLINNHRPGMVEQAWGESYYTKASKMKFIPWLLYYGAKTTRTFAYTNMQYKYVPPIMKEVTTTVDGLEVKTLNTGFDYYTGVPVEMKSKDSYGNTKIKRVEPAYWRYPDMGPSSVNSTNQNNLVTITGEYLYLNQIDDNHLLNANITTWSKDEWEVADYQQPKKKYDGDKSYYVYEKVDGNTIKNAYSQPARKDISFSREAQGIFRSYEQFVYDVAVKTDGTYASFVPFNYTNKSRNTSAWKKVLTNELFDANGTLLQSKDILGKYVSQHMGYNFSNAISIVANASYMQTMYDGAENTYKDINGKICLEADRVQLGEASVYKVTTDNTSKKVTPNYAVYLQNRNPRVIQIIKPDKPVIGAEIGRLQAYFEATQTSRTLIIKVKDTKSYQVLTDAGESFEGFIRAPQKGTNNDLLIFDWGKMNANALYSPTNANGYTSKSTNEIPLNIEACEPGHNYVIPGDISVQEAHTGNYVFLLQTGKAGTIASVSAKKPQQVRKFKCLVWLSKTSPKATSLVVRLKDGNALKREVKTSLSEPYAVAGNWCLLRTDIELSDLELSMDSPVIEAFVVNESNSGVAVYDDFRLLPYDAEMSNKVFEHQFNRLSSTLDADNFATYYMYDNRGRVIESSVEVQNVGRKTVKKMRYNDQLNSTE